MLLGLTVDLMYRREREKKERGKEGNGGKQRQRKMGREGEEKKWEKNSQQKENKEKSKELKKEESGERQGRKDAYRIFFFQIPAALFNLILSSYSISLLNELLVHVLRRPESQNKSSFSK